MELVLYFRDKMSACRNAGTFIMQKIGYIDLYNYATSA